MFIALYIKQVKIKRLTPQQTIFFSPHIADNDTRFLKGCLDYGKEPTDFLAAWPEDQACVTITDGDIKGIPSGHGCKCSEDNCNFDICTAAAAPAPEDRDGGNNSCFTDYKCDDCG